MAEFQKCIILRVALEKAYLSGGPIMPAISVKMRSQYLVPSASADSKTYWKPYMPAILITIGTIYGCNLI